MFQNTPNPFTAETVIEFEISEQMQTAFMLIFDMQGTLKKTIPLSQKGKGQITINGKELTPGMYLYSLIVNEQEVDTKRMILME